MSDESCWKQLKSRKLQIWGGQVGIDEEGSAVPQYLSILSNVLNNQLKIFKDNRGTGSTNDIGDDNQKKKKKENDETPNHYLINHYCVGEGILPHQDGPRYLPKVVILSLQESCVFSFHKYISPDSTQRRDQLPVASLCLKPNSLLYFTEDAYHNYLHSIAPVVEDIIDSEACGVTLNKILANVKPNEKIRRINSRISLTIRKVFWPNEDERRS